MMNNSQDSNVHDITFPTFGNNEQESLVEDDPSFLLPRRHLYEEVGITGRTTALSIPRLTQVWMNERNAPELLPYERNLVEPLITAIETQAEYIMEEVEDKFISMLYQTEIERIKYLLKSYLRVRLNKIEKYTLYILRQDNLEDLLSEAEIIYGRRYQDLIEAHNFDSFLHQLPLQQHKQDEVVNDLTMVVKPNFDTPVFVQVLQTIGHILVKQDEILLEQGDVVFLGYIYIKEHLSQGKVRLV